MASWTCVFDKISSEVECIAVVTDRNVTVHLERRSSYHCAIPFVRWVGKLAGEGREHAYSRAPAHRCTLGSKQMMPTSHIMEWKK